MEADNRERFIESVTNERQERKLLKNQIILLQAMGKGVLVRKKFADSIREDFDHLLGTFVNMEKEKEPADCKDVLWLGRLFRLCQLCRCMILSMSSCNVHKSFACLLLSKIHLQAANRLIISVYSLIASVTEKLQVRFENLRQDFLRAYILYTVRVEKVSEGKTISLFVHFLITFSSANSWAFVRNNGEICCVLNQLGNKALNATIGEELRYIQFSQLLSRIVSSGRLVLGASAFNGLFNILFRILKNCDFDLHMFSLFVEYCLTSPALLTHLSAANIDLLVENKMFEKAIAILTTNPVLPNNLDSNKSLFLLANLIHLSYLDQHSLVEYLIDWTDVMNKMLTRCDRFSAKKKSSRSHWHPIFGWYSEPLDRSTEGSLPLVVRQLQYLWSKPIVACLFGQVLHCDPEKQSMNRASQSAIVVQNDLATSIQKLWKKLNIIRAEAQASEVAQQLPALSMTAVVCQLYRNALLTLNSLHTDILSGLCQEDFLLPLLWEHIVSLSPADCGLSHVIALVASHPSKITHFAPIVLFANCATSVISILDEEEMYEQGGPFTLDQLCAIARFCNLFCFRVIWNSYVDLQQISSCPLFSSIYQLCMLLYNRDCRRAFSRDHKFWIAPDVKSSIIMNEFEKKTERALFLMSHMSHLVALYDRIVLFRKYIASEKETMEGTPGTMITVERNRLLDDGYRQLSLLSPTALKATIRVKFINQQGLDEAGIDQDGVFKEFLELTLKHVFNPDLNLFKCSPNGQLFPSPTSDLHENHLALFQFVGRMLAKAVYEGIVTEVHLAPVLLATALSRKLCAFDELSQLDPDLYKSLTYVKHYSNSDVADLSLTFSIDEDVLGHVRTVDLVPGGHAVHVTNENKIAYVHKMAQYRVFNQTKEQCHAFVSGFLSVLNSSWLSLFAPHELQYLISGQSTDIDLHDLRKHVQYYGGFHNNHRVIKWLWQILENDFTAEERRLFLKFVTSCSRAPLLGFAYLEPPFSIRCVEVSDDQDQGDTLASVVRGFLAIKRRQSPSRLPTASTCFNLLKLPNYGKKSVLLQKLRYAVHSETGFELS
uniref:Ubiquitin-protein ligase E3B n=1 Tax=Elaeophora elaphi TaxID=1147741 RepID=A0A0R3S056_9BILA